MTKKIVAIWAEDENRLIGVNDGLPWRLPKELKHFNEIDEMRGLYDKENRCYLGRR